MTVPTKNETWIIETGATVIEKEAECGLESLSSWERLVYCLWVADYGMRNAGDLETASDVYADFQQDGKCASRKLSLPLTGQLYSMTQGAMEKAYLDQFEAVCDEIRAAEPSSDGSIEPRPSASQAKKRKRP